jgi:hypothetical protein
VSRRGPGQAVLILDGACAALPVRVRVVVALYGAGLVICDVSQAGADLATVDALARARLAAGRLGAQLRLRRTPAALEQLLADCGLDEAVPAEARGGAPARPLC